MHPEVRLKIRVRGRHPWFYRKMVERPAPGPARPRAGGVVRVVDAAGRGIGTGFYNPRSELAVRMLARRDVDDTAAYLRERLDAALALRDDVLGLPDVTDGYRLVHAEGDGFPGLVLDRLGDVVVAQVFALCIQERIEPIGERLLERYPGVRLVLTVDDVARKREGMTTVPPARAECTVVEHGIRYAVEAGSGHKTGFFADQRDNRQLVRRLAGGRQVLDLFCNAGGFALNAARGGADRVLAVDLDESVVARARENARANGLDLDAQHDDAFDVLRGVAPGAFDLMVLDPPKWAAGKAAVDAALERYLDLNRLALEKLEPGGHLITCSCSGALSESRFLACLRDAAARAGRDARVLAVRGAGPDHPVALECPETRYLKVAWLQVRGR